MSALRDTLISAGLIAFAATGLHKMAARFTRGRGVILTFHHVRPANGNAYAPNRLLEITPQFLDGVIGQVRASGFEIVAMDTALERLARPRAQGEKPFAVLTFDDGYRDNLQFALPVLRARQAPFTLYVTTGFADRSARLWWRELEAAVQALPSFRVHGPKGVVRFKASSITQKTRAFHAVYWMLRGMEEKAMLEQIARLAAKAAVNKTALVAQECMDWQGIAEMAREPLCTIGVHTLTHPMLAKHPAEMVEREMAESRRLIEGRIGRPARHLSYPVGDKTSAGPREFAMAAKLGFASAVTTRPGMIVSAHADRLTSLPRVSVNGKWQSLRAVEVLLSGAPFALVNRGRAA